MNPQQDTLKWAEKIFLAILPTYRDRPAEARRQEVEMIAAEMESYASERVREAYEDAAKIVLSTHQCDDSDACLRCVLASKIRARIKEEK